MGVGVTWEEEIHRFPVAVGVMCGKEGSRMGDGP